MIHQEAHPGELVRTEAEQVPPPEATVPEPPRQEQDPQVLIRQMLEYHNMPDEEIRERLRLQGIEVAEEILTRARVEVAEERRRLAPNVHATQAHCDYDELMQLKEMAVRFGGVDRLRKLVDALSQLQSQA